MYTVFLPLTEALGKIFQTLGVAALHNFGQYVHAFMRLPLIKPLLNTKQKARDQCYIARINLSYVQNVFIYK